MRAGIMASGITEPPLLQFAGVLTMTTLRNGVPVAITSPPDPLRTLYIGWDINGTGVPEITINDTPATVMNNQTQAAYRRIGWVVHPFPVGDSVTVGSSLGTTTTAAVWVGYGLDVVGGQELTGGTRTATSFSIDLPPETETAPAVATSRQNHYVTYGGWEWDGARELVYTGAGLGQTSYQTSAFAIAEPPGASISVSSAISGQGRGLSILPLRRSS